MDNSSPRRGIHIFCPRRFCHSGVTELTVAELRESGIEAVLLDLDNTLVAWQGHQIPDDIIEWLAALSEELDIPFVRRAWKPRKKGFQSAMAVLGATPEKTVMVGDQMFTDVFGANRVGIYSIMVRPLAQREFVGTKISRMAERVLLSWFRKRGHVD